MANSPLTEAIDKFGLKLRGVDGKQRSLTDQNLVELVGYVEQLARRVDKLEQGD
ncbi:MAG: hypothetical protein ACREI2_03565 [Nitrospiraceae bacterium]